MSNANCLATALTRKFGAAGARELLCEALGMVPIDAGGATIFAAICAHFVSTGNAPVTMRELEKASGKGGASTVVYKTHRDQFEAVRCTYSQGNTRKMWRMTPAAFVRAGGQCMIEAATDTATA